jgi:hypothetical protein
MDSFGGFNLTRVLGLLGFACASLTISTLAHAYEPDAHWTCNAERSVPGTWTGTTATLVPGARAADIRLSYHQHLANGEATIFGNLVSFGTVWLNDDAGPPIFSTDHDIMAGDLAVPAGSYSLYFLPSHRGLRLIVNKKVGQAANEYDASEDVGWVNMVQAPAAGCEILTLNFEPVPGIVCLGPCRGVAGPFISADVFGKPTIHFAWAEANFYVVLRPSNSLPGSTGQTSVTVQP